VEKILVLAKKRAKMEFTWQARFHAELGLGAHGKFSVN